MSEIDLRRLTDKFPASDVGWRIAQQGEKQGRIWAKVLAYVTNRAIMERLDEVVGPANWRNEFREWQGCAVLCGLSVRVEGEWVTKWDGAENTDIEPVKGGLSGAMKRAAVQWGVGRYLYDLDEAFAVVVDNGEYYARTKDGKSFHWNPPPLPAWATPAGSPPPPADSIEANRGSRGERADARQANPPPPATDYCTAEQKGRIKGLLDDLELSGREQNEIIAGYPGVKRWSQLTVPQAGAVIVALLRRLVNKKLLADGCGLEDVQKADPSITADDPDDLTAEQADAALAVLRKQKEGAAV